VEGRRGRCCTLRETIIVVIEMETEKTAGSSREAQTAEKEKGVLDFFAAKKKNYARKQKRGGAGNCGRIERMLFSRKVSLAEGKPIRSFREIESLVKQRGSEVVPGPVKKKKTHLMPVAVQS